VQSSPESFQSTRPARGAARWQREREAAFGVSIHAPRAGRGCGWAKARPFNMLRETKREPRFQGSLVFPLSTSILD
jgi:hypothetical protein